MKTSDASIVRQIGASIFNVAPSMVNANNLSKNTWVIEREGIVYIGELSRQELKSSFEIKEGDREFLGKKYTIPA